MKFLEWFETFLEEKQLPYVLWELTSPFGMWHYIDNEAVIEHIKMAPDHEQTKIKDVIVKIDFANGDVNHFFKHLATALVARY